MTKRFFFLFSILLLFQGVSSAQYAILSKDSVYNSTIKLQEVTVSSSKELHNLKSLPAAVTLVAEHKIEDNDIFSLKDLSSFIPNLFMPDYGSRLTSPIYIRGIGSKTGSPSVGLYVDGIPYFEKACFDFDFSDIQGIEVLRGPQGTLYGRNTMGGIINIHTKSPEYFRGGSIHASFGEYGYTKIGASTYNKLSNKLFLSINANYNHKNGFFVNEGSTKRPDEIDSYNVNTKLVYKKSDRFKTILNITYQGSKQGGYPYGLLDKETMDIAPINYDQYSSYNRDIFSTSIYNEYKTGKILLSSSTSYNYYTDHQAIDQDFSPVDMYFVDSNQKQHMLSQEITIKSAQENNYKWILGVFGFYQDIKTNTGVVYGMPLISGSISQGNLPEGTSSYSYEKNNDTPTHGLALFHQSTYDTGAFSFSLGARLDYERAKLDFFHFETINTTRAKLDEKYSDLDFFEFLPKVSIKYHINKNNFIYTTIAKGYKTGGFNSIFEIPENIAYNPEVSWNYELGIKTSIFSNRINMSLTGFYIKWDDQQIAQTVPSGRGRVLINAGESESKGVEFESSLSLIKGLEINANYGFTSAKFLDYKDPKKDLDYSGNYIPYIPKQTLSAGINYKKDIKSNILNTIKINVLYKGFGEHYWDVDNNIKQSFYYTLDSKISFIRGNLALELWGKNLTNSEYIAYHFASMGKDFAQYGKPSYGGITLKCKF